MNHDGILPTTGNAADPVKIDCDWHRQRDQKVLFDFWVERQGQQSHVEALIDLLTLDLTQAQRLKNFLERLHAHQTSLTERVRTAEWLVNLSLCQQRPEATQAQRDAEVRALLLFKDNQKEEAAEIGQSVLSAKQAVFAVRGQNFVNSTGDAAFFEDCQRLPHYQQIHQSCLESQDRFDFGTPKVPTASPAEQALAEMFFLELRHAPNPIAVQARYNSLVQPHLDDQQWLDAIASTIQGRKKPSNSLPQLDFFLLCSWLPNGLWGMTHPDRLAVLKLWYGVETTTDILRKRVNALRLRDWADFRGTYPFAPIVRQSAFAAGSKEKTVHLLIRNEYLHFLS